MRVSASGVVRDKGQKRVAMQPRKVVVVNHVKLVEVYHALWQELHTKQDADPEWFSDWIDRVPNIDCGCRKWLRAWLKDNPTIYGDGFYGWTVTLHDAVNAKLGKPIWNRVS